MINSTNCKPNTEKYINKYEYMTPLTKQSLERK